MEVLPIRGQMSVRQRQARVLAWSRWLRCNGGLFNFKVYSMTQKRRVLNTTTRKVLVLTALSFGIASGVQAQVIGPSADPATAPPANAAPAAKTPRIDPAAFNKADTNKDDRLSRVEVQNLPSVAQHFRLLDTDQDGTLSRSEFSKAEPHS